MTNGIVLAKLQAAIEKNMDGKGPKPTLPLDPDLVVVGVADEYLRALFSTFVQFKNEYKALKGRRNVIAAQLKAMVDKNSNVATMKAMASPEALALATEMDAIGQKAAPIKEIGKLAQSLFWAEINAAFPELSGKDNVGLDRQWNVGHFRHDSPDGMGLEEIVSMLRRSA